MPAELAPLLTAGMPVIVSLLIIVASLIALRIWRSSVQRLAARALARDENAGRERQLKIQTLTSVGLASGTIVVVLIGSLMVLSQVIEVAPLLAGAGILGVAIGLGAQSLIRDVISGFFILLEDHYVVGDVVQVNGQYAGFVEHLDLRRTVLRNLDGWLFTIPNGEIKVVANMTREWSRMVVDVAVAYREDTEKVIEVLQGVSDELMADAEAGPLLLEPPEVLGVEKLDVYQVTIRVLLKTEPMKQWAVGRRYRALLKQAFNREGIEIPFPHQVVLLRTDGRGGEEERPAPAATAEGQG